MTVILTLRDKEYEAKSGMTLHDSLIMINIQPESVLAIRDNEIITDDEVLIEDQVIRLIAVVSGG
jgi:sulfur carrier protein ThiS